MSRGGIFQLAMLYYLCIFLFRDLKSHYGQAHKIQEWLCLEVNEEVKILHVHGIETIQAT